MKEKIKSLSELKRILQEARQGGRRIVFTNGCFDLLHVGHVRYLQKARSYGDLLVVGLNGDASVRRNKGEGRPLFRAQERGEMLAALACVDYVVIFEEDDPHRVISELVPDVLVKGGDWQPHQIVGRDIVQAAGGKVISVDFEHGYSTTSIIRRIRTGPER